MPKSRRNSNIQKQDPTEPKNDFQAKKREPYGRCRTLSLSFFISAGERLYVPLLLENLKEIEHGNDDTCQYVEVNKTTAEADNKTDDRKLCEDSDNETYQNTYYQVHENVNDKSANAFLCLKGTKGLIRQSPASSSTEPSKRKKQRLDVCRYL